MRTLPVRIVFPTQNPSHPVPVATQNGLPPRPGSHLRSLERSFVTYYFLGIVEFHIIPKSDINSQHFDEFEKLRVDAGRAERQPTHRKKFGAVAVGTRGAESDSPDR